MAELLFETYGVPSVGKALCIKTINDDFFFFLVIMIDVRCSWALDK